MIFYETTGGVRTKATCARLALINWYVDQVIATRHGDQKENNVYVSDRPLEFLVQVVGMVERLYRKTLDLNRNSPPDHQYKAVLRFIHRHGDIKRLVIAK